MTSQIACPGCGEMVDPNAKQCPHCGVALGYAAALLEQAMASTIPLDAHIPITPEILVPRLGEYLIERGVLTQAQLEQALSYSEEARASNGDSVLVGQALLELRLVDRETLDQVVTEQILELQNALRRANRNLEERVQERTRELQSALNKLTELSQLKSNFLANVSHELRTPLTHIKGYLDLLSEESLGFLTTEQTKAVEVMLRAENRLEILIEELIQFSIASSGTFDLKLELVNLFEVTQSALIKIRESATQRSITIREIIPSTTLMVKADRSKLWYVLTELLDNAIKFTPSGGVVQISLVSDDTLVNVAIQDTGIGIAKERLHELYEPFHQLDGSISRRYGGVGLGLAMVRKIVEAHGSSIEVTSIEGKGSRFSFRLPLAQTTG